jgi:cellulose synthase/poly-beta-1,6-N-acetylglucosamine synthase-like glycosyltransferase
MWSSVQGKRSRTTRLDRVVVRDTAATVLSRAQVAAICVALAGSGCEAAVWGWHASLTTLTAICEAFYLIFVGFKVLLAVASYLPSRRGMGVLPSPDDPDLPTFTILLPNVKEKTHVLRALLESMANLEYPAEKLQVVLLAESWDERTLRLFGAEGLGDDGPAGSGGHPVSAALATVSAGNSGAGPGTAPEHPDAERVTLRPNVEVVVSTPGAPGTKPSACDFGLYRARGDYTVIFDSEDSPDPRMLLKAVRDFRAAPPSVACLQARLLFWNVLDGQLTWRNWLAALVTRMYFVEYVVHFEFVLRGMARIGLTPPLGGTSNIFVTDVLREIAIPTERLVQDGIPREAAERMIGAWDPWCVAEDADIAGWLARSGYQVAMISDSWTLEEAPHSLVKAARQRARWGKGYAQAGAVQSRHPLRAARQMGIRSLAAYALMTIGTPLSLMLNPAYWALTLGYLLTRSAFIHSLFPAPVFYLGFITAVLGNFILFYIQVTACLRDREPGLVKYMLGLAPWWLFTSYSMWKGVLELFIPGMRFHWHVTEHGNEDPHTARREIERRHLLMSARKSNLTPWQPQVRNE